MSMEKTALALRAMAEVDLQTEGDWSADTANERCAEYARLISKLFAN